VLESRRFAIPRGSRMRLDKVEIVGFKSFCDKQDWTSGAA
jgi:hypothetical protein